MIEYSFKQRHPDLETINVSNKSVPYYIIQYNDIQDILTAILNNSGIFLYLSAFTVRTSPTIITLTQPTISAILIPHQCEPM